MRTEICQTTRHPNQNIVVNREVQATIFIARINIFVVVKLMSRENWYIKDRSQAPTHLNSIYRIDAGTDDQAN